MTVVDLIEKQIQNFIEEKRPPLEIRNELDIGYSYEKKTVEIFEIRPQWDDPSKIMTLSVTKAKYVKTQNCWKVYWMRGNGKWTPYDPSEVEDIGQFLKLVKEDPLHCFWG